MSGYAFAAGMDMATDQPPNSSPDLPRAQRIPLAPRDSESDDAGIADYLGLTVETVSRILSRLKKAGHMAIIDAHHITIAQPDALSDIAGGYEYAVRPD